MLLNIITAIIMVYLISRPSQQESPKTPIFEEPEHLCECSDPIGEGFWCDRCGGWLPAPGFAPRWLVYLVAVIAVAGLFLTFSIT